MKSIWLHVREETNGDDRKKIRHVVTDLEAQGWICFDGDIWEQRKNRDYDDRDNEILLKTDHAEKVRDFLHKRLGQICWVEREATVS